MSSSSSSAGPASFFSFGGAFAAASALAAAFSAASFSFSACFCRLLSSFLESFSSPSAGAGVPSALCEHACSAQLDGAGGGGGSRETAHMSNREVWVVYSCAEVCVGPARAPCST